MSEDEKVANRIILDILGEAIVDVKYIEYKDNPNLQTNGVDFIVLLKSGRVLMIDDKMRKTITKDLCVEMQQVGHEFYPKKSMADIILYRVPGQSPFFIFTCLIEILFYLNPQWRKRVFKNKKGDGYCAYVPLVEFKEAVDHIFGSFNNQYKYPKETNSYLPYVEVSYFQ